MPIVKCFKPVGSAHAAWIAAKDHVAPPERTTPPGGGDLNDPVMGFIGTPKLICPAVLMTLNVVKLRCEGVPAGFQTTFQALGEGVGPNGFVPGDEGNSTPQLLSGAEAVEITTLPVITPWIVGGTLGLLGVHGLIGFVTLIVSVSEFPFESSGGVNVMVPPAEVQVAVPVYVMTALALDPRLMSSADGSKTKTAIWASLRMNRPSLRSSKTTNMWLNAPLLAGVTHLCPTRRPGQGPVGGHGLSVRDAASSDVHPCS